MEAYTRTSFVHHWIQKSAKVVLEKIIPLMLLIFTSLICAQTDKTYRNYAPVLSPDGQTIAYYGKIEGNWDIYIIDIEGNNKKRITDHKTYDGEPSWSPDGSKITFVSDRDGDDEIYIIDLHNGNMEQVTANNIPDNNPTFSPDGKSIYYRTKVGAQWFIFRTDLEGKSERILADINVEGRFRWSTEGKSISFITTYQNRYAICRIDDIGNPITFTFSKFGFLGNPHYSDAVGRFVFDAHKENSGSSGDGKWELWTVKPDGSDLKQVTNNELDDWGATWSVDGSLLVFAGKGLNNTGYEVLLYDLVKQAVKQITFKE